MSDSDEPKPKFTLAEGTGTAFEEFPFFIAVRTNRGTAWKPLEAALEPLHRLVYGRPGVTGERRAALAAFKGFPEGMSGAVRERLAALVGAKLKEMIRAFEIDAKLSSPQAQLVEAVHAFLMRPAVPEKAAAKRARAPTASAEAKPVEAPEAKKRRREAPASTATTTNADAGAGAAVKGGAAISDDAVRVQVYRRVLGMTPQERSDLGTKALRVDLERHFALADGELKDRKDVITETATECVRALLEAEENARGAAAQVVPTPPAPTLSIPDCPPPSLEGPTSGGDAP